MRAFIVTRVHFRSHDKMAVTPSDNVENPMLHASFVVVCVIKHDRMEVLHCEHRNFRPRWLLWPWPWLNDFHIRTWPVLLRDILDVLKWIF